MKRRTMAFGGLLMAVAITGYSVAGTYAKYISTIDITDEARVAQWNFNNESTRTVDLFEASYKNDGGIYVASKDGDKVIAPGTSGSYEYKITGTAETNYKVIPVIEIANEVALFGAEDNDANVTYYNPIEFRINGGDWKKATVLKNKDGKRYLTFEETAVDNTVYPANHVLTETGKIEWRWEFETGEKNALNNYTNDALDTLLGQKAVNEDITIKATISVTVVQTQDPSTYTAEDGSAVATSAPVTFTNRLSNADQKDALARMGYDAVNSKSVIFNGTKLTGTIYKTNNAWATRYMGESATGYYYPITIKAPVGAQVVITYDRINEVNHVSSPYTIDASGELSLIMGLTEGKNIKYAVTVNGETKNYEVDVQDLTFAEK